MVNESHLKLVGKVCSIEFLDNLSEQLVATDLPGVGTLYQGDFEGYVDGVRAALYSPMSKDVLLMA
jgi:hypothetical protein